MERNKVYDKPPVPNSPSAPDGPKRETDEAKEICRVPPNGGVQAWLCVVGGFCCQFCSFGFVNACGAFQLYYETDLLKNYSSSAISWIVTIQIFLMFFLGTVTGILVDAVGPRPVVAAAGFLSLLGICMLSLCKENWQIILAQRICFGTGAAGLFLPSMVAVGQWFSTKKGLAMGIVASGSSVGGTIFPIMVPRLIRQHEFPAMIRWVALLIGILIGVAIVCVTGPFPPRGREKKASSGLAAYKSLTWLFFLLGCFFIVWGLFGPFDYMPLMAISHGMSENLSTYTVAITNACSIFGRVIPGYLSDKMGQLNIMMVVGILSGVSILCFWLPLEYYFSNAGILVFGGLYGAISGGFIGLMTPCVIALSDGNVEALGARLGGFMVVLAIASLTGLPIMGAIDGSQANQSYTGLIIYSGVVMTLGGAFITAARLRRNGLRLEKV
ncbi:hypothetical protein RBB50_008998 [Rhinocladiella similis]